jgi:hypothetical protein
MSKEGSGGGGGGERKIVAQCCFELFHWEMIKYWRRALTDDASVRKKIKNIGFEVGFRLTERVARTKARIGSEILDAVKFVCRDLWQACFKHHVDNLKTNSTKVYHFATSSLV